jgi:type IX secretion system substrate protein
MKKATVTIICIFMMLAGLSGARGQSISPATINSTGGTGVTSGNDYDWSVAEMTMVSTFSTASLIVTQGILQPADTNGTSGVDKNSMANKLAIFPNPASTLLNIQYTGAQGALCYRFMDLGGKVIMNYSDEVKEGTALEKLNISNLAVATYMLEISFKAAGMAEEKIAYKIEKIK